MCWKIRVTEKKQHKIFQNLYLKCVNNTKKQTMHFIVQFIGHIRVKDTRYLTSKLKDYMTSYISEETGQLRIRIKIIRKH